MTFGAEPRFENSVLLGRSTADKLFEVRMLAAPILVLLLLGLGDSAWATNVSNAPRSALAPGQSTSREGGTSSPAQPQDAIRPAVPNGGRPDKNRQSKRYWIPLPFPEEAVVSRAASWWSVTHALYVFL